MLKWNALTVNQKIAVMAILVPAFIAILGFIVTSNNGITQTPNDGDAIVHMGNGDIKTGDTYIQQQTIIGLTLEQHEQSLKRREIEVRAELKQAHAADRQILERELNDIEQQLQDTQTSHETHIADLKERITQLEQLRDEFPDALLDQAIEALRQGDSQKAVQLFQQIKEEGEGHIKRVAEAEYQLGKISEEAIRYTKALEHYERAVQLQPDNALYLNDTGLLLFKLAHYQKAIDYFEQALASNLKTYGEDHPYVATRRNNLGLVWNSLGKYEKAIEYYEQALASDLKTYGEDHPHVATHRSNLGIARRSLGEYEKAIEYYEQALASDLKTYGEDHPHVATHRSNLGMAWASLGKYEKAIDYLEQALASDLKTYGEDHPHVAIRRNNLGFAWNSLGKYEKAIDYLEQALASDLKTYGEDHPQVATYRNNLGFAWHSLGEYHKAIDHFEQALPTLEKFLGKDHPNTKTAQSSLNAAQAALKN